MSISQNLLANADDLGLNTSVNKAILYCFENGYINSTSFITNTIFFDETVDLIKENPIIINIGVHINFAEGKPVTSHLKPPYIRSDGTWALDKINKKINILTNDEKKIFISEISAQIEKALSANIEITHLDSHFHLHALPCFYHLFLLVAEKYKLKVRLAQTYNEGNYLKYLYRVLINNKFKTRKCNYSDRFETVSQYLKTPHLQNKTEIVEIMLHPDFDLTGNLTDHYDANTIKDWIKHLNKTLDKIK